MIWSCSNRVTVGYPASTQVFGPELANCRPAICSPRPAPPGSTRTLIDVQVDFVAVVVGAGVLLLRGGGARRSAGVLALSDEVRGRIGVPGAADETLAGAVGGMLFVLVAADSAWPEVVQPPTTAPSASAAPPVANRRRALPKVTRRPAGRSRTAGCPPSTDYPTAGCSTAWSTRCVRSCCRSCSSERTPSTLSACQRS